MENFKYGDNVSIDFAALPEVSQVALIQRGLTHVLGNEVASRVHAWAMGEGQANSEDKEVVKAWKLANASAITSKTSEVQADMVKALTDGTLGSRTTGPRLTPLETVLNKITRGEVETILRANSIKVPKGDDKVKMPDGEFTMKELIVRRLAKPEHGDRLRKLAEKEVAAQAKAQKAITDDAATALAAL